MIELQTWEGFQRSLFLIIFLFHIGELRIREGKGLTDIAQESVGQPLGSPTSAHSHLGSWTQVHPWSLKRNPLVSVPAGARWFSSWGTVWGNGKTQSLRGSSDISLLLPPSCPPGNKGWALAGELEERSSYGSAGTWQSLVFQYSIMKRMVR